MTIEKSFLLLFLIFKALSSSAQSGITWLREDMPNDSIFAPSFENHSSLLPKIRVTQPQAKGFNLGKTLNLIPLADLTTFYDIDFGYRLGFGAVVESNANWKKMFVRAGATGGLASEGSINNNRFEFTQNNSSSFAYFQPIVRLSYTPNHIFNFQIGHDKNFIGEGNRSLFLSDFGKPYYFGQIRAKFWHVEYQMMYQFFNEEYKLSKRNKFAATHYLSWNISKKINLGVFESVIFQPKDTFLYRGFDVEYLNPVVLFRPQEYAMGSSDNVLLGASFSIKLKKQTIYGQLIVDEFLLSEIKAKSGCWANKYGGQLGIKGKFNLKKENLFFRVEANAVRPYTYSHVNLLQNYGNQNTTLSHPYGANFIEILGELKWQKKKWFCKVFMNYGLQGLDKNGKSYGGNIYLPYTLRPSDFNNEVGQGIKNNFFRFNAHVAYKLTNYGNIYAFGEIQFRYDTSLNSKASLLPVIGIRSYMWNDYRNY